MKNAPAVSEPHPGASPLCLPHLLDAQAARRPEAVALAAPGRPPLTFGRLRAHLEETVDLLGVGREDRVALLLPDGPELAVAVLAVAAGATCAPLNPALRAAECETVLADLDATALVVRAGSETPAHAVARARGIRVLELTPSAEAAGLFTLAGDGRRGQARWGAARPDDVALILPTSGTTARPKLVPLTHANLCASAANIRAALALAEEDRGLNVMPLFHIHGLMMLLASLAAGAGVMCPPGFDPEGFFAWLNAWRPTWYSAVSTLHQAILREAPHHREVLARCPLRFVRSSSAPLPPPLAAELERVFGVPAVEAYGMTEAAHQIATNPLPPGTRKAGSVGRPAGTEVAILDAAGRHLAPEEPGEVAIRGPNVMQGYVNDPVSNAAAFTDGWFRTGDVGSLDADGYLFLTGRLKELINRGGEKIAPREVEEVLLGHPAVADVAAFAVPHPTLGEDVVAAVVLRPGSAATDGDLRTFAAERVADFKVPRQILILDEIPTGPSGKVQRLGLAERLGLLEARPPSLSRDGAPPPSRTPLERTLASIWSEVLDIEGPGVEDNFFALGGDSIRATLILSRVRQRLGIELPPHSLFETPTLAAMAAHIESASFPQEAVPHRPIPRTSRDGQTPLSFAQERLWFLQQLAPRSPVYNAPQAVRIRGPLSVDALRAALDNLVARHETLRTVFVTTAGVPGQVTSAPRGAGLTVHDLTGLPESERETMAGEILRHEARYPYDLGRDPMLRATLLRLDHDDHALLLMLHHIVSDWWSMRILLAELGTLYGATGGGAVALPPLPIQYAEYAVWQRQWLQGEILERQLAYWGEHLKGAPPTLDLPTDRPRPADPSDRGAREPVRIPAPLTAALKELSRQESVTLFMTLLAAFQTLLHRYTGQEDLVVGSPIAGRTRRETEEVIGCFVNTLALRTDLSGDPPFRDLLQRVRTVTLGALEHQDLPFERLVEKLRPERRLGRTPLFQAMLVLQDTRRPTLRLPDLTVSPIEVDRGTAMFDLTLSLVETADGLAGYLEYSTDLFEATTAGRMLGHFRTLLEGIVADPRGRLSGLPLLTEGERHQLLVEWNATASAYPRDACLHHLFEGQVERSPDAVAAVCGDETLTYRELNRRANRLAHSLRGRGVGPDVLVAVCMERSLEMLVGLIGTLKAGGAYIPLDPTYPAERLAFMLEDAQARILLTQEHMAGRFAGHHATVLCVRIDEAPLDVLTEANLRSAATADHLAYVIYTSGSTGKPKGAMITHRGLVNYLTWCTKAYEVEAGEGAPVHSSISFDLTVTGLFAPLLVGRRVRLLPERLGLEALAEAMRAGANYSLVKITPAHLALLSRQMSAQEARGRTRAFVIGGENLLAETLRFWQEAAPDTRLVNEYGPTETVVGCCVYQVPHGRHRSGSIPIGRPIANTRLYVLDGHMQPVPIGVPGELYIGGDGVARGYLHRPELTAERFVPDPFTSDAGTRLYRTGDLVRYRADGHLEFLGRLDHQVKLRGYRIEPGEIEATLGQHPAVCEAVVVVREDPPGDQRLLAYLTMRGEGSAPEESLRAFLRRTLPEYMIPSAFVTLDALPMTPNGKVDRRALPAPDPSRHAGAGNIAAPHDPLEQMLANVWEDVLGVRPIGMQDDFFALGGHSLLAVRLFAEIAKATGRQLPLTTIFRTPTIERLAETLRHEGWRSAWSWLLPLRPGGSKAPLFCVHQHTGQLFCYQPLVHHLGPDQPVYGIIPRGLHDGQSPWGRIEEMAGHYVQEIRQVQRTGPYLLAGYCFGGIVAFEMAHQLIAQGQGVGLVALLEATWRDPLSPVRAPLRRLHRRLAYERDKLAGFTVPQGALFLLGRGAGVAREGTARFLESLRERLRSHRGRDTDLEPAVGRVEAAHRDAVRYYVPQVYPGRLDLFRPAGPSATHHGDPTWGWGRLAGGGIEVHEISALRPTIVDEPDVRILAERLRACIAAAQDGAR